MKTERVPPSWTSYLTSFYGVGPSLGKEKDKGRDLVANLRLWPKEIVTLVSSGPIIGACNRIDLWPTQVVKMFPNACTLLLLFYESRLTTNACTLLLWFYESRLTPLCNNKSSYIGVKRPIQIDRKPMLFSSEPTKSFFLPRSKGLTFFLFFFNWGSSFFFLSQIGGWYNIWIHSLLIIGVLYRGRRGNQSAPRPWPL